MKKGLLILGIVSLVALVSVPLTMNVLYFSLPDVYLHTFYGGMKNKIDRLYQTSGKKIVIIGGSSVPFSLDSSLIKECLDGYEVVDFGLYAALGTNAMLDLAKDGIKGGDIVIVSPEISKQTLSMYFNPLEMSKALERNKDMLFKLNGKMQEGMIAAIPSFNAEKISYLSKGDIPMPKDIYASSSFNEYGDIKVTREGNIMFGGIDKNNPISIDKAVIEDEFIKELNNFAKTVKDKGGECYFRFSPMNASSISYKDDLRTFYDYLDEKISFGILGDPYKAIMEKEWFYDTNFHLNSPGAKMWTKNLINDIKVTLNITSPTPIKDEDKPPLSSPDDSKDGDNSFLDCFEYEEKENEVVLTKLIKESEDIIVPYKYNGKIITSFNDDVFQGKKGIREITIQDNIRLLYDYSFSGSGVNKIVISNDRPNSIGVGDHLLNGANAYIYVDKDNLNTYKTSYNWAKDAPYIRSK